jgi:hypothetical protein
VQYDQAQGTTTFDYYSARIFPNPSDPTTPGPKGALNLYYAKPGTRDSYLQVKPGEISHPNFVFNTPGYDSNNPDARFTDSAGRMADDTCIPEFIDQYSEQLPILYIRANQGATAICAVGGMDKVGGSKLTDPTTGAQVQAQYDLAGILQYTQDTTAMSGIGTKANDQYLSHHGLQGLGTDNPMTDTIDGAWKNNGGNNALAYFKDPSSSNTPNTPGSQNVGGTPRQKNGYILISAGPDRIFGTSDDVIYPGSLNP